MLRNIVGPPAREGDFYDREELIELIWERLETGNILLAAPRRFGKTSVMYRLIDHPRSGWKPVHVDAESIREPANFVIAILDALFADQQIRNFLVATWGKASKWVRGFIEDVEVTTPWDVGLKIKLKEKIQANWQEHGEELLRALRTFNKNNRLLIIIDELPVMLQLFHENNISSSDIRVFLFWFRKMRTDPKIGLTNCRFLTGGSIGIEHYLSKLNAAASFNDFEKMTLNELGSERGGDLLEKLLASRKISLSAKTKKEILNHVGAAIPYFIQVFVTEIGTELANRPGSLGPKRLEEVYQQRVLGASCKSYFEHYYDRLRHYEKGEELAAKALLKELALNHPKGIQRDHLYRCYRNTQGEKDTQEGFARLVSDLENDFYIRFIPEKGYFFASKILCDWWRRYYAF